MSDEATAPFQRGAAPKEGELFQGRYQIERRLGEGGMGVVYVAFDKDLQERVALKLLQPTLAMDSKFYDRFRREVSLARSLSHPNIVRTFDLGRADDGSFFMTMEYVPGKSIKDEIEERGNPYSPTQALDVILPIGEALEHAHKKGVLHRDIKPANVLRTENGEVKLLDFGTARTQKPSSDLTQAGEIIGTPAYMAPEQIQGVELDGRCDQYALGLMLFELLTGKRPFAGGTSMDVLMRQLQNPLPMLDSEGVNVSPIIQNALTRATEKDREKRFPSVREFCDELRHWHASVTLPAPEAWEHTHLRKPKIDRAKLMVAALLTVLVVGVGGVWWMTSAGAPITVQITPPSEVVESKERFVPLDVPPPIRSVKRVAPPELSSPTVTEERIKSLLPTPVPTQRAVEVVTILPTPKPQPTERPKIEAQKELEGQIVLRSLGHGVVTEMNTSELQGARWVVILPANRLADVAKIDMYFAFSNGRKFKLPPPNILQQSPQLRLGGKIHRAIPPGKYRLSAEIEGKLLAESEITVR